MTDDHIPDEPVILPWAEMQKKAERDGVDVMVYVNSMHAHVQRQRDEITRLNERVKKLVAERNSLIEMAQKAGLQVVYVI